MFNRTILPIFVALICLLSVCTCNAQQRNRLSLGLQPNKITVDGRERTYRVVVPANVREPMPLVLVLHGGGFGELGSLHVIGYTEFTKLALQEKFIVVYPIGVDGNWNDGRGAESIQAQRENVDDVKFLRMVVDTVAKSHPVDRSRVFSTGISNGAFMSHRLAAEASDLVAGIAPVVGSMSQHVAQHFSPKYPVSLFIVQGDTDPLVPFAGGQVGSRGERGVAMPTDVVVKKYTQRNGIQGKPVVSMLKDTDPNDGTVTQSTIYPVGSSGAKVQVHLVKGGGHTWPGKKPYLTEKLIGKTSQDYDATEAIWEFFKSCPSRQLR